MKTDSWFEKERKQPYLLALLGVIAVTIVTTLVFWRDDIVSWQSFAWAALQEFIYNLAVMIAVMFAFGIQKNKTLRKASNTDWI